MINFFSTIPAIMFLDRWGRRKVLIIGAINMSIAHMIVGTLFAVYQHIWETHRSSGWAVAVFIWFFISNFAFSIVRSHQLCLLFRMLIPMLRLRKLDHAL